MKKKMYSCIVVVGGGFKFEGAQQWLQYKVWVGMPPQYRLMLETMDVITKPKVMCNAAGYNPYRKGSATWLGQINLQPLYYSIRFSKTCG